jgi:hypothetical protein
MKYIIPHLSIAKKSTFLQCMSGSGASATNDCSSGTGYGPGIALGACIAGSNPAGTPTLNCIVGTNASKGSSLNNCSAGTSAT